MRKTHTDTYASIIIIIEMAARGIPGSCARFQQAFYEVAARETSDMHPREHPT